MGATTQPLDFSDLYTDLQNRARVTTGVTATENQAKRYINIGLKDMHIGFGEHFPWCHRRSQIRTHAQYTTGTVVTTAGSTTVTGTSTAWATANSFSENNMRVGGKISFGGSEVYEISTVTSDTVAVLNTAFISTALSGASYTYFEDEYALASDFMRPLDLQSFSDAMDIPLIARDEFRRSFPRNNVTGRPKVATLLFLGPLDTVGIRRRVRFYRPPDSTYLIPYEYVTNLLAMSSAGVTATDLSADADQPIVPLQYRHAIVLHGLKNWYRDKKDDARSQEVNAEWTDLMTRIVGDQEIGTRRPRIQPRTFGAALNARQPWGGSAVSRYTTGARFDEMR